MSVNHRLQIPTKSRQEILSASFTVVVEGLWNTRKITTVNLLEELWSRSELKKQSEIFQESGAKEKYVFSKIWAQITVKF